MRHAALKAAVALILGSIPTAALAAMPAAASSTSATWSISCKGDGAGSASWTWYDNGVAVGSGGASCSGTNSYNGTSSRPADATSVDAQLSYVIGSCGLNCGLDQKVDTFAPGGSFSISLHASASTQQCSICGGQKLSGSANFGLKG